MMLSESTVSSTGMLSIHLALLLGTMITVVSSAELKIEPENATLFAGQDVSIRCHSKEPLLFCRFKLPGYKKAQILTIRTKPKPDFAYFGKGLEKGDCGITLFSVGMSLNGTIECMAGMDDETDEVEAQMTLTVKPPACKPLPVPEGGQWSSPSCTRVESRLNQQCNLTCSAGRELSGGGMAECTDKGWVGKNGLYQIPDCKDIATIAEEIINEINSTMEGLPANMLFVLDESGSIAPEEFDKLITFIKSIVHTFPLSSTRSGGILTFHGLSDVDLRLDHNNSCTFMEHAERIQQNGGGTDILGALNQAISEITAHGKNRLTLVFLITDGESSTDPTDAANQIKSDGNVVFCIGIGNYKPDQLIPQASISIERSPLFFGIDNFDIFMKVADYLEITYININEIC